MVHLRYDFWDNVVTLTDTAYQELEERIVTLQLRPGQTLSEGQLVEALAIKG